MSNSPDRSEIREVVELVTREAVAYLESVDDSPLHARRADSWASTLRSSLPQTGDGAVSALRELIRHSQSAAVATSGPRCFHFVIGGATPAALGADWLATALDQMAYAWVASPVGTSLEVVALEWLRELFELPAGGGSIMTTGATMANFVGLACARQWWGERHSIDVGEVGLVAAPAIPVFSSGHLHASALKALAMLGIGRASLSVHSADGIGNLDLAALEAALKRLDGAPAILVANAGEVNNGAFDPIDQMAELARAYGAWLHVDGAFGLFARLVPSHQHLAAGAERADSITVDGHKWLNVPYDCGFSFVKDRGLMARAFRYDADYLPDPDDPHPNFGALGPESSRRARAFAVWATLSAYGRKGYREMVENHLRLAVKLAESVRRAPELELLAEPLLNIVCFRYKPANCAESALDDLNQRLGEALLADGRVYAGTTRYDGKVALRPAIVNWRTREEDVLLFVDVVRELGAVCGQS